MKVLFLDIDGVVNCAKFARKLKKHGMLGIDPKAAQIIRKIIYETECHVVISSSWRSSPELMEIIRTQVTQRVVGITPHLPALRGVEVQKWLDDHKDLKITRYAILDDDSDFLPGQPLFKTTWESGITKDIARQVTDYLRVGV